MKPSKIWKKRLTNIYKNRYGGVPTDYGESVDVAKEKNVYTEWSTVYYIYLLLLFYYIHFFEGHRAGSA